MAPKVVVLGAGVSGLTTALLLARSGDYDITIIAKHMPGDYDIEYASPWAGANYLPHRNIPPSQGRRNSYRRLVRRAPKGGCLVQRRSAQCSSNTRPVINPESDLQKFRILPKSELPAGIDGGTAFTSVCFNTALYLPWLTSQCLKHGVTVRRGIVSHVAEAANLHHTSQRADLVVNCTGLASLRLGGVEDAAVYPARGQIVVVRNDPQVMASVSGTDDGSDEATYIMHRAAGGGCILGGCLQKDNWESQPDPNMAVRIMKRCVELCPKLVPEGKGIEALSIVRHSVGLRPMRKGGPRVERETIDGVPVVHNYGHGGYGYQTSYGAAQAAGRLVRKALGVGSKL
ncbi:D-amino acid oxidase [Friedmanniomyces endolithicus]|nr:D-amino acid oxidase [Friedmanniomyces endolithicus]